MITIRVGEGCVLALLVAKFEVLRKNVQNPKQSPLIQAEPLLEFPAGYHSSISIVIYSANLAEPLKFPPTTRAL